MIARDCTTVILLSMFSGVITGVYVVVQFYPCFKFYFHLFLGIVMYDNEFKTKEEKNLNQG